MFNAFYPREYVDSAYDIPYEEFYGRGIRGVILTSIIPWYRMGPRLIQGPWPF